VQPLDPLTIPLQGRRLLEASAGTGKTYTLALLFLRLLLERQLEVDRILVVTFTRAATSELRDRIRTRLREALDHLESRSSADPHLSALLATVSVDHGTQLLTEALARMDEAAIHTIHGFCQRILQDHAFECGQLFEFELLENEEPLRRQCLEDFWRNRFYPASEEEVNWAVSSWGDPAGLSKALGHGQASMSCDVLPMVNTDEARQLEEHSRHLFIEVQREWSMARESVQTILMEDTCLQRNAQAYRLADRVPELLAAMDSLAEHGAMPLVIPHGMEKMSASTLESLLLKKCLQPPSHPFFSLFDAFYRCHQQYLRCITFGVVHEARNFLHTELARRKQSQGVLAFDDLLTRLAEAMDQPGTGPLLLDRIRERFPAALVDEFQDTDPLQYRVFSRIYSRSNGVLFMIGDPKQAIYSFRGADIFTYIRARRDTFPESRYTMDSNYRSTPAMVKAVNTLFGRRSDAFVFAEDIVFHPVRSGAGDGKRPLQVQGLDMAPLSALILSGEQTQEGTLLNKETATHKAVALCADTIVGLLEQARNGQATIGEAPLTAGDIAILVRTHREAEAVQAQLQRRGLNSVSHSQASVFATEEARQLTLVLSALANPFDRAGIRACLATDLFGHTGEDLQALTADDHIWQTRLDTLLRYRQLWLEQGFMAMFQHLVADQRVTRRLSARPGGERRLTNLLHLAELLQESPAAHHGTAGQLRWLWQQIHTPDDTATEQLIRLESDADLIRIITIHRAKGLEFPVVFLPFLWSSRSMPSDQPLLFHDRKTQRLTVDLGTGIEEHRRWAEEEQRAEDLRLLYVAVTRAQCCCLFCWGRVRGVERTALAHLLHGSSLPGNDETLIRELGSLDEEGAALAIRPWPSALGTHRLPPPAPPSGLRIRAFHGRIDPGWSMTSYSRLTAGVDTSPDRDDIPEKPQPMAPEDYSNIFTFPRGPDAGTCLHSILERLEFSRPLSEQQALVSDTLEQAGINLCWLESVSRWLEEILAVPLPSGNHLNELVGRNRINEFSFLFPMEHVSIQRFNEVLAEAGCRVLTESGGSLHGLMKGFIDLVFRYQDRYFIIDYKSNHLGFNPSQYGPESLQTCMDTHQYHLQALIYTLALHRFLRTRIKDYDYDTHFGGVFYLFLRGMHPEYPPGTGIHTGRPDSAVIDRLDACLHCKGTT
jgi:exodeoxyribonuclease V beta subunit